jgi:hypothetical protein
VLTSRCVILFARCKFSRMFVQDFTVVTLTSDVTVFLCGTVQSSSGFNSGKRKHLLLVVVCFTTATKSYFLPLVGLPRIFEYSNIHEL